MRGALKPIGKSFEAIVAELSKAKERAGEKPVKEQVEALRKRMERFANPANVRAGESLELYVLSKVESLFGDLQDVDAAPTPPQQSAVADLQREAQSVIEQWRAIPQDVAALNSQLETAGLAPMSSRAQ